MEHSLEEYKLDNGLHVVLENIPYRSSGTVCVALPIGSRAEKEAEFGYSHFVEHMLFKGTKTRSNDDITDMLDSCGGFSNASTSQDLTNYYITLPKDNILNGIEIVADMYYNSIMPQAEFEKERDVIVEEIKVYLDRPDWLLWDIAYEQYYGDKSELGHPILGPMDHIQATTREDLMGYYHNHYDIKGSVLSVAGMLWQTPEGKGYLLNAIDKYFGITPPELKGNLSTEYGTYPASPKPSFYHYDKDMEQNQFLLSLPGTSITDTDGLRKLNIFTKLTGSGMSSRLAREVREKEGLCYSIYAHSQHHTNEGLWSVYCGTSKEQYEKALALSISVIQESLHKGPRDHSEYQRAVNRIIGTDSIFMENSDSRANYNISSIVYHNRLRIHEEETKKYNELNPEETWDFVRNMWKDSKYSIASIGPLSKETKANPIFQPSIL